MDLGKRCVLTLSLFLLTGCSTFSSHESKEIYQEGYRAGVGQQVKDIAAEFQGGNFPYYHWTAPIVQEVRVPAHLTNGVMIPEHNELVIIEPGQWSMDPAYPIKTQEKINDKNQISYMDMDVANITALPRSSGSAVTDDK